MPTYEYECSGCGHKFEMFQSIKAQPARKCPACGRASARRLIGTGAGVIFRGSGFYQTDYRSESYRKRAEADKPQTKTTSTDTTSSGATKSESAPSNGQSKKKKADG